MPHAPVPMPPLSLTPQAVPLLCQLLIAGTAAVYLLSLPRRTRATRWLGAVLGFSAAFSGAYFLATLAPAGSAWEIRASLAIYVMLLATVVSAIQAAYTFVSSPFRKERRIVLWLSAGAGLALFVPTVWAFVRADLAHARILLGAYSIGLLLAAAGSILVLGRKAARMRALLRQSDVRRVARLRAAEGIGAFIALLVLDLAMALLNAAAWFGVLPLIVLQYGSLLGQIVISVGFVVLVINHAPEPSTVQAKIVGLALATVLAVLGVASLVTLRPTEIAETAGNVVPQRVVLRFEPREAGGYRLDQRRDGALDSLAGGRPLRLADLREGSAEVALPFAFPFGDGEVRDIRTGCSPVVVLDGDPRPVPMRSLRGGASATIAAFLVPGVPASAACLETAFSPDRAVFDWARVDVSGRALRHRLVLFPDGAFELAYDGPPLHPVTGGVGFRPSRQAPFLSVALAEGLPASIPAGVGMLEDYEEVYRNAAHDRALPFALLVIGAMAFVMLLFPVFLRRGILRPLQNLLGGVERVQLGDLDARVPVRTSDEFGLLARAFNGMAASVSGAEYRLRAYADTLETRVVERTAELESSLDELQRTQGALVETEKMASLGRLTSGIAHEIKNPLNFVVNFADLQAELLADLAAAMGEGDRAEVDALLEDLAVNARSIQAHGARADGIVRAMQLHARGAASGERIPTDLNGLLRLAAEEAEKRHPDLPPIALDLDEGIGEVPLAPEGILQAVVNLLDNALYATRQSAEGDGEPPRVTLCSERRGADVGIRVCDRGPGISDEVRDRLFEPFVTTKPTGEGVGLGLSLAYGIVTAGHGGRLEAESREGDGATFCIWLPMA